MRPRVQVSGSAGRVTVGPSGCKAAAMMPASAWAPPGHRWMAVRPAAAETEAKTPTRPWRPTGPPTEAPGGRPAIPHGTYPWRIIVTGPIDHDSALHFGS